MNSKRKKVKKVIKRNLTCRIILSLLKIIFVINSLDSSDAVDSNIGQILALI